MPPAAAGQASNGSGGEAEAGTPPAAAADSRDPAASLEFLDFQPPAGVLVAGEAQASDADGTAPRGGAAAHATAQAAPAAPEATPAQPQSQNGDAAPAPRAAPTEGVEQAEELLDVVFVSSEAGEMAS